MKRLFTILALCLTLKLSSCDRFHDRHGCLMGNGFQHIIPPAAALDAIGDPDETDIIKNAPKEKLVDVIVCLFHKDRSAKKNLNATLEELINMDDKMPAKERREMLQTLQNCSTRAKGNESQLLNCVNAIEPPFDKLTVMLRDVPFVVRECFLEHNLTFDDLRYKTILHKTSVSEMLEHVSEDKLTCALTCELDKSKILYREVDQTETLFDRLMEYINRSEELPGKKKEMRGMLNRCSDEAGKDSCKLAKCIKVLRPPFSFFYFKPT